MSGRWRLVPFAGVVGAAVGCAAPAASPAFAIGAAAWQAAPDGHLFVTAGSKPGTATTMELEDHLGLEEATQLDWHADVDFGDHRITFEHLPLSFAGDSVVDDAFIFHGATYPVGDRVVTAFDLDTFILRWDARCWSSDATRSSAHVGLGAWWWRYAMQVEGSPSGNDEVRQFSHLYPGVHGDLTWDAGSGLLLALDGAFAGTGTSRTLYDLSGSLIWEIGDHVGVAAGYRFMRWDFNESTNDGDFDLRGPWLGLTFRF